MPEVRTLPSRGTTSRYSGPLPQREHRKIALSVEGEAAALTAAAPQGMKVEPRDDSWLTEAGMTLEVLR